MNSGNIGIIARRGVGMSNDWPFYVLIGCMFFFMFRLERLGKQIEAVCANIKAELSPSEAGRRQILDEWKETRADAAKETRQQLIGEAIIGALLFGWFVLTRN